MVTSLSALILQFVRSLVLVRWWRNFKDQVIEIAMKKHHLLSVICTFLLLAACNKEEALITSPADQELETSISDDEKYSEDTSVDPIFIIGNEDNKLLENETLVLSNITKDAISYYWDFGNGHHSTQAQPHHSYKLHGYYTVSLTTVNAQGEVREASEEVLVLCLFGGGKHDQ